MFPLNDRVKKRVDWGEKYPLHLDLSTETQPLTEGRMDREKKGKVREEFKEKEKIPVD